MTEPVPPSPADVARAMAAASGRAPAAPDRPGGPRAAASGVGVEGVAADARDVPDGPRVAASGVGVEGVAADAPGGAVDGVVAGTPAVAEALERLATIDELPLAAQVAEYETVHRALQDTLAAVDES